MKKKIGLFIFLLLIISPLMAYEWGGVLKNKTYLKTQSFDKMVVDQKNSLYFWYSTNITDSGIKFIGEGVYSFIYNQNSQLNFNSYNSLDIDLLKIYYNKKTPTYSFSYNIGRFPVSDISDVVLNQNIDGALFKIAMSKNTYSFFIGYTGLLNEINVPILDSHGIAYVSSNRVFSLAYPFILLNVSCNFPNLFLNQNLKCEIISALDFGAEEKNRYYLELGLNGSISKVKYKFNTILQSFNFESISLYTSLLAYMTFNNNMLLGLGFEYSSGKNGGLSNFIGITSRVICNSFSLRETTGVFVPKLSFMYVADKFLFEFNSMYLLDCLSSNIQSSGIEADLVGTYNVFSDLQLSLGIVTFTSFKKDVQESNYAAVFKLAFAF